MNPRPLHSRVSPPSIAALSLLAMSLLSACNEHSNPSVDFSPPPGATTANANPVRIGERPAELSLAERRQPLTPVRDCNLERVNGTVFSGSPVTVARDASVVLSGWVADVQGGNVPATLDLRLVGSADNRAWKVQAHAGGRRDDVKALLGGNAAYASPAFAVTLDPSALPPGTYRAYVVFASGSEMKSCDNGRSIALE